MKSLAEYESTLTSVKGGTVTVDLALEIVEAWRTDVQHTRGEYTLTQAVEMSGKSRSWFERRVEEFEKLGLARKLGGVWLLKRAAIPDRAAPAGQGDGFDPSLDVDELSDRLLGV